jgi:hypothetical protein
MVLTVVREGARIEATGAGGEEDGARRGLFRHVGEGVLFELLA